MNHRGDFGRVTFSMLGVVPLTPSMFMALITRAAEPLPQTLEVASESPWLLDRPSQGVLVTRGDSELTPMEDRPPEAVANTEILHLGKIPIFARLGPLDSDHCPTPLNGLLSELNERSPKLPEECLVSGYLLPGALGAPVQPIPRTPARTGYRCPQKQSPLMLLLSSFDTLHRVSLARGRG